jgi:hypothetical protein
MTQCAITDNDSVTSEKGFFKRLAGGDFGLARTYWLYGVLVSISVNLVSNFFITSIGGLLLLTLAYAAYDVPVILGTWRAARKYQGPRLWANLAKSMTIVGAIMLAVVLVLLLVMLVRA